MAFPVMKQNFFNLLTERVVYHNFTSKKLEDAVNNVIDNFKYKELNISDLIGFDKKIKLFNGKEFCEMQIRGYKCSDFGIIEKNEKKYFYLLSDYEQYM